MEIRYRTPIIRNGPRIIYTIRHGESEGNARGLDDESLRGQPNHRFPLTTKGIKQISTSASYIKDEEIIIGIETGLYASGFFRTQQSMEIVLEKQPSRCFEICIEPRLDEWWKGIFHSLSDEEIEKHYKIEKMIRDREGWHHYRPPQGHAGKDVELNLLSFVRDAPQEEIFISGHGRNLGFLRRLLTNHPLELNCEYPIPSNGELWKFSRGTGEDYYKFESLFKPGKEI